MRYAYFVCVTGVNNNKWYEMKDDGVTIHTSYGRVGGHTSYGSYPSSQWNYVYNKRIKNGYQDVSDLRSTESADVNNTFCGRSRELVDYLLSSSRTSLETNYLGASGVTQAMVDRAQSIINDTVSSFSLEECRDNTIELYTTIPRKMDNVANHLRSTVDDYHDLMSDEQDLLNQLSANIVVETERELPFTIEDTDASEIPALSQQISRKFNVYKASSNTPFTPVAGKRMMLWHGSRTQNWIHILSQGLKIYPANAVRNGSAFGMGLYFADQFEKSYQYCHTYQRAILGVYDVSLGNWMRVRWGTDEMRRYDWEIVDGKGYQSLFGDSSLGSLRMNEYIIYREQQCSLKYIVEVL